jgi:hypothetical protein
VMRRVLAVVVVLAAIGGADWVYELITALKPLLIATSKQWLPMPAAPCINPVCAPILPVRRSFNGLTARVLF